MIAPLACTASASSRLGWFVDRAVERLAQVAPEALAVDLVGSLARGEGTVLAQGERWLVLSDLDLAVVFREVEARDRALPRLARLSRELSQEFACRDFLGAVDLGPYALRDLPLQAPRPGTLEWARCGVTVAGDGTCRSRLPKWPESAIPAEEALLLVENRLLELLWTQPLLASGERGAWAALYAGGKGVLDAALARLVAAGRCPGGVKERAGAYAELVGGADLRLSVESLRHWTEFKLEPGSRRVAAYYGEAAGLREWAEGAWREGGAALLAVYARLVTGSESPGENGWLRRAASRARWRRRVRRGFDAWRERRRRDLPWGRLSNLAHFARRGTPEHLLGATAAALVGEAINAARPGVVPAAAVPAVPGFVAGAAEASWETRRQQAVTAWDRWVLRGARCEAVGP